LESVSYSRNNYAQGNGSVATILLAPALGTPTPKQLPTLLGSTMSVLQAPSKIARLAMQENPVKTHRQTVIHAESATPSIFPTTTCSQLLATSRDASSGSDCVLEDGQTLADKPVTTLMIRNLPPQMTQLCLLKELDEAGFEGLYDFVYMPQSFNTNENSGFAFVNFLDPCTAGILVGRWHRQHRFGRSTKQPPLNIAPADVQGLEANLHKWLTPRLRRVKNPNFRPFVLEEQAKAEQPRLQ